VIASPAVDDALALRAADAARAVQLLAVDFCGLGGVRLRASAGAVRDAWLAKLRSLCPVDAPWQRLPAHVDDDRLLGGLDLAATLQAGRPVMQSGLLACTDGGVLVVPMAERLEPRLAARLNMALDQGAIDAGHGPEAARLAVVALDEGNEADEAAPASLQERLGLAVDLHGLPLSALEQALSTVDPNAVTAARRRLALTAIDNELVQALCEAGVALGVASLRGSWLACRVARAAAALGGRAQVLADDAALAARLVLAPRATRIPAADEPVPPDSSSESDVPPPDASQPPDAEARPQPVEGELGERLTAAATAAIPPGLLAMLLSEGGAASRSPGGRAGNWKASVLQGRPCGSRRGLPRGGARLHLIDTLRAASPWQRLRERESVRAAMQSPAPVRIHVRREDFRITRRRRRTEVTTLFVVDASGSAALHRLGEAKGAVELLLADCYVRRDRVALLAFRGQPGEPGVELLLPPTRSLARAKRSLAALPGGGGTPLAAGLDAARALSEAIVRRGGTPVVVLLTDGRANVARDGQPGRAHAVDDALAAARAWRGQGVAVLLLDTAPQPQREAQQLALAMGARYLPLPHADAHAMSQAVQAVH
jgi:magnesium chelatase subunit D